jgi:thiopeptide-type bacteriocin biosynthesis protein
MLNPAGAPSVCRFLQELGLDGRVGLARFDWGPASALPFLPRVRFDRVILRCAQWRMPRRRSAQLLQADDARHFRTALESWRAMWSAPRLVYLAAADNRLLLDLEDPLQSDLLREELVRDRPGDVILEEALPAPEHAWLEGPGGTYVSELVIPMVLHQPETAQGDAGAVASVAPERVRLPSHSTVDRRRPPGSDWLYFSLTGQPQGEDALLAGPVRDLTSQLVEEGDVDDWFFVRYGDPQRHLRLRLHGDPERLCARVLPHVTRWGASLIAAGALDKIGLEVYERELERYGGVAGTVLAETVFSADSDAALAILGLLDDGLVSELDRVDVAVFTTDALLQDLGMDSPARRAWAEAAAPPRVESGAEYRVRKARLRKLLGGRSDSLSPLADELCSIVCARSAAVRPIVDKLAALDDEGRLSEPLPELAYSLAHLHANRIGLDRASERLALGLLHRTLASLQHAPLAPEND